LKVTQKRGVLTCRPPFKNAPAAFLRARFLGAMRIVNADDRIASHRRRSRRAIKCLRTGRHKEIITPLPAAASRSDRRQPFSSRLSRDTVRFPTTRPEKSAAGCYTATQRNDETLRGCTPTNRPGTTAARIAGQAAMEAMELDPYILVHALGRDSSWGRLSGSARLNQ
jgi:hypothetical protein